MGIGEIIGGVVIWGGTIIGAGAAETGSGGAATFFVGAGIGELLASGAFVLGKGLSRVTGSYNVPFGEYISNAFMPVEFDASECIDSQLRGRYR